MDEVFPEAGAPEAAVEAVVVGAVELCEEVGEFFLEGVEPVPDGGGVRDWCLHGDVGGVALDIGFDEVLDEVEHEVEVLVAVEVDDGFEVRVHDLLAEHEVIHVVDGVELRVHVEIHCARVLHDFVGRRVQGLLFLKDFVGFGFS